MTEALQRQLANDEPKCANCEHWDFVVLNDHFGYCERVARADAPGAVMTTDLTVCSKWEKRDAQTEAETQ